MSSSRPLNSSLDKIEHATGISNKGRIEGVQENFSLEPSFSANDICVHEFFVRFGQIHYAFNNCDYVDSDRNDPAGEKQSQDPSGQHYYSFRLVSKDKFVHAKRTQEKGTNSGGDLFLGTGKFRLAAHRLHWHRADREHCSAICTGCEIARILRMAAWARYVICGHNLVYLLKNVGEISIMQVKFNVKAIAGSNCFPNLQMK